MSDNTNNGFPVPEEPLTREEEYLSAIAGVTASTEIPEKPLTRVEAYLDKIVENGGSGSGFEPTDAQLDAMNSGITSEDVEQISTNKNNILSIQGDISDLGEFILSPNLFDKDSCIVGKYLTPGSGRTYNDMSDNADFTTSNIIPVIPNKKYCTNSYISVGSTAAINCYDTSGNYLQQLSPSYRSNFINVYAIPNNAYYVRFSFYSATSDIFNKDRAMFVEGDEMPLDYCPYGSNIITNSNVANILNRIVNPCDYQGDDAQVFNKCLCIGDSITEGTFNYKDGSTTKYVNIDKYSYPTFLTKISGIETTNMGVGGYTSVEWWNANQSTDFSGHDICIINLGINDVLESVSTADTKTALANIIAAVKAANTGIKVFLASVVPAYSDGTTNYDAVNTAIREVASTNAAYFIDLARYSHVHKGTAYENGHLTAYGYWRLAKDYLAAIGFIMHRQPSTFKYIQFIGTNYTP